MSYFYLIPTGHESAPDFVWETKCWSPEDADTTNSQIWQGDMLGILLDLKLFASRSQARAVGWGNQIPWGYHEFTVGKLKTQFVTVKMRHLAAFQEEDPITHLKEPEYICPCGEMGELTRHDAIPCPTPTNMKCPCGLSKQQTTS